MLPFAPGINGHYTEERDVFSLELRSLRNLNTITFSTKDPTVINTIKGEFSPILEDYLGDSLSGFSDAFMEMQSHPIPFEGEEREFDITDKIEMKFCWIPAGKAMLGSPENEEERRCDEIEHEFETNGFWMGKYPVIQSQWKGVMGNNPSHFNGDNLPVEMVSWYGCQEFIKKCRVSGLKPQLPHEDQWEYACRGGKGNKQAFYWGNTLNGDKVNCRGNWLGRTTEVGSYEKLVPHTWGLCDMIGNVWEWCENLYRSGDSLRVSRVARGGGWGTISQFCRSSFRAGYMPEYADYSTGFRLIIC